MYVLEVIPLIPLPQNAPQILSYFHDASLQKGAVVEIRIGTRKVRAVVISSNPLEEQKLKLKKTGFQLKKVSQVVSDSPRVNDYQFRIALWLARQYYAPLGLCLKTVLPPFYSKAQTVESPTKAAETSIKTWLTNSRDNIGHIKNLIEPYLRKGGQVALIVPEIDLAKHYYENLGKQAVLIHSGLSVKEQKENWNRILSEESQLIIGTRIALFSPYKNLTLLVVDDPNHEAFKSDMTPRYHAQDLALEIAKSHGAEYVKIMPAMDVRSYFDKDAAVIDKRSDGNTQVQVINITDEMREGNFSILSHELKERVIRTVKNGGRALVFCPRRGYANLFLCHNCGFSIKCKNCDIPIRVHKDTGLILICHRCGLVQQPPNYCINCNSHELKPRGQVGTQKIFELLLASIEYQQLPKVPLLVLDGDVARNDLEKNEIIDSISGSKPSILISTHMIFSYRHKLSFDFAGLTSLDSLTSMPDYKGEEDLIYNLSKLRELSSQVLIQTLHGEDGIINKYVAGEEENIYDDILEAREHLAYPPFSRLAKLTYAHYDQGKAAYASRVAGEKLRMAIAQLKMTSLIKIMGPSPAFIHREKGLFSYNIILKLSPTLEISQILKFVPPNWSIDLDPRNIL